MKKAIFSSVLLSAIVSATARQWQKVTWDNFSEGTFQNKLDHFSTDPTVMNKTYAQRYWYNDEFWDQKAGPVFIYICGEWTCNPPDTKMYLTSMSGFDKR